MTSCRAQFVPRERRRRTIAPEATLSAARSRRKPVQRASEPGSACAAAYPAGSSSRSRRRRASHPVPADPLLERHPPVFARAEHPRDEDVGEAALAQVRGDRLDELAATSVGALVLVRREDARRAGDDQAVGVAGDRLEILSLDRLEVVERVQQCAEPDQRQRPRVRLDRDCTVRVPCGEECVHSRRGLGLERGDEVHADRHVRQEVRSLRRLGVGLVRDEDLLVRNQAHGRTHVVARGFEDACRHEPVRVEPGKRRSGVLPRHLVSEEEEPDQGVERLPLGDALKDERGCRRRERGARRRRRAAPSGRRRCSRPRRAACPASKRPRGRRGLEWGGAMRPCSRGYVGHPLSLPGTGRGAAWLAR